MARGKSEQTKRIALAGLGVVLLGVVLYQFLFSGPAPRPPRSSNRNSNADVAAATAASRQPTATRAKTPDAEAQYLQQLLGDLTPLNFDPLKRGTGPATPGPRGSVFAVYVEPPPPVIPPKPATIKMQGIQPQGAVAEVQKKIILTVNAAEMPPDAAIYFDSTQRPTRRVSANQLSTEIQPSEYASPRTINVQVKSPSKPQEFWSDSRPFVVQAVQEPAVKYIARLGKVNQGDSAYGVFEVGSSREVKRLKRGDTLAGVWRIDAINADSVDLTHAQYEIKRKVRMQERPQR
jgi:hypothetical protein